MVNSSEPRRREPRRVYLLLLRFCTVNVQATTPITPRLCSPLCGGPGQEAASSECTAIPATAVANSVLDFPTWQSQRCSDIQSDIQCRCKLELPGRALQLLSRVSSCPK